MSQQTIQSRSKGATNPDESNDCVVRALSNASGMPYNKAHALLKNAGRKERNGVRLSDMISLFEKLSIKPIYISSNTKDGQYLCKHYCWTPNVGMSLGKSVKTFSKGKYIALVNRHAVALVDGHLIDTFDNPGKQYLRALFKVE